MAEFRTPFFRSYLCNDPALVRLVLNERPADFPKSGRMREGLTPLLGNSVFVTNGEVWERQRRIIDPAFEGGRLRDTFPAMLGGGARRRWRGCAEGEVEVEARDEPCGGGCDLPHAVLDPDRGRGGARGVFAMFRAHQRSQPILNLAAFLPLAALDAAPAPARDAGDGARRSGR